MFSGMIGETRACAICLPLKSLVPMARETVVLGVLLWETEVCSGIQRECQMKTLGRRVRGVRAGQNSLVERIGIPRILAFLISCQTGKLGAGREASME